MHSPETEALGKAGVQALSKKRVSKGSPIVLAGAVVLMRQGGEAAHSQLFDPV